MLNNTFKIVYFIGFLIITIVRKYYTSINKKSSYKIQNKSNLDFIFLILNGLGMIIPIFYVLSPWFDFANYYLPDYLGWIGSLLFVLSMWLLWKSHKDLSKHWTPTLRIIDNHKLITNGIYKHVRHPMYSAHFIWALAQILLLHNWIAGYSFIIVFIPFCFIRIKKEEEMMINYFGEEYKTYMKRTKRIIPKFL